MEKRDDRLDPQSSILHPRRKWWRYLLRYALLGACCYVGVVLVLMALENSLVYFPTKGEEKPPLAAIQDHFLTTADGTKIHVWWYPHDKATGALLFCHGNGGNLTDRADSVAKLHDVLEESILIVGYPGYGQSEGSPSEAGCYAAADAGYEWLIKTQQILPERILLYGESLGGGVIVDLASRRKHRALIIDRSFTSAPDAAHSHFPWLPTRWLMRNRFDSISKIRDLADDCKSPIFIAHGTRDSVIPFRHGEELFAAAHEPKIFLRMEGVGHNDPLPEEFYRALRRFLNAHR